MNNYDSITELPTDFLLCLACYQLGGAKKQVHSEEIMFKAFEFNKEKLSWKLTKFKKFPDTDIMRRCLLLTRKKKLMTGAYTRDLNKDGWILTKEGIEFCKKISNLVDLPKTTKASKSLSSAENKELNYFKKHKFQKIINEDNFNIYHVSEMINEPTNSPDLLRRKISRLINLAQINDDKEALILLKEIKDKPNFSSIFSQQKFDEQQMMKNRSKKKLKAK